MAFPTTFLDLQRAVQKKLRLDANADAATGSDLQLIKDTINQVYAAVCEETECTQTSATMTLTPNVESYVLPTAILRIHEITAAQAASPGSYGAPLESVSLDEILGLRQSGQIATTNAGTVRKYALVGMSQLELWPTPSVADVLRMFYTYLPTALSAGTDVPVIQEPWVKLLELGALADLAPLLENPQVQWWDGKFNELYRRFVRHLNRRQGGGVQTLRVTGRTQPLRPADRSLDIR